MGKKFGATGEYPRGKLNEDDEGELQFGIAHDPTGVVHINFGKKVTWIALSPPDVVQLCTMLLKHAGAKKVEIEL